MANTGKRLKLDGVQIRKRNFRGERVKYNDRGNRTCLLILDRDQAEKSGFKSVTDFVDYLRSENWKVGVFPVREGEDEPDAFMQVNAIYNEYEHPNIYLKNAKGSVLLDENSVGEIDYADIANVDCILYLNYWKYDGSEGFNNRIKSMEVTILEDEITYRNTIHSTEDAEYLPF